MLLILLSYININESIVIICPHILLIIIPFKLFKLFYYIYLKY